jgi:hypothetical protein
MGVGKYICVIDSILDSYSIPGIDFPPLTRPKYFTNFAPFITFHSLENIISWKLVYLFLNGLVENRILYRYLDIEGQVAK